MARSGVGESAPEGFRSFRCPVAYPGAHLHHHEVCEAGGARDCTQQGDGFEVVLSSDGAPSHTRALEHARHLGLGLGQLALQALLAILVEPKPVRGTWTSKMLEESWRAVSCSNLHFQVRP